MRKVGITGGIGSGKSTVCALLHELYAIPIYYADARAKVLMREDKEVRAAIELLFGDNAYLDGELNSSYIASKVFDDSVLLGKLNQAVHGAVQADFQRWAACQQAPYVVCEAAILIESGWYKELDVIVVVEAPMELRIERVMRRDNVTRQQVEARIANQLSDAARAEHADIILAADGRDIEELVENLQKELIVI